MLKTKEEGEEYGELVVESKKWRRLALLPYKGNIWREEKGIVVVAYETVSGEECMLEALHPLCEGLLLWFAMGDDLGGALILVHRSDSVASHEYGILAVIGAENAVLVFLTERWIDAQ